MFSSVGKQGDQWSPSSPDDPKVSPVSHIPRDPESLIIAMERVTVLFDRYTCFDILYYLQKVQSLMLKSELQHRLLAMCAFLSISTLLNNSLCCFDRIRKGFPYEARVITRVLPTFLVDFFPPQDIMNKVIGEFLSSQQPHPQLMATVVFKVSNNLNPMRLFHTKMLFYSVIQLEMYALTEAWYF